MNVHAKILPAALLIASAMPLMARVIYDTGLCSGGGRWIVVTTLDAGGRAASIRGTNCAGTTWTGSFSIITIADDPTDRIALGARVYYHAEEKGSWVRYTILEDGMIGSMWGLDADGIYWTVSKFAANLL